MTETRTPVKVLYTAEATATGGRAGHAESSDGRLKVDLSMPAEMGGDAGAGTNPEQLFAAGYAACFQGAMGVVARREKLSIEGSTVTARVGIGPMGQACTCPRSRTWRRRRTWSRRRTRCARTRTRPATTST